MRKDYWKFVEWIWSKRDQPYLFRTSTVTESNRKDDSTLPNPALEPLEATELFDFLAEKGLVTEKDIKGEKVFRINKIEAYKWNELIKELKKKGWRRSWVWNKLCGLTFWIITLIIAAWLGAYFNKAGGSAYENRIFHNFKELRAYIPAENDQHPPPNEVSDNPDGRPDNGIMPTPITD